METTNIVAISIVAAAAIAVVAIIKIKKKKKYFNNDCYDDRLDDSMFNGDDGDSVPFQ